MNLPGLYFGIVVNLQYKTGNLNQIARFVNITSEGIKWQKRI